MAEKIRLTVLVDESLRNKLKVKCAQKKVTMTDALVLLISDWLSKK